MFQLIQFGGKYQTQLFMMYRFGSINIYINFIFYALRFLNRMDKKSYINKENGQTLPLYANKEIQLDKPAQWEQMDNLEGQDNLDSFKSDVSHQIRTKGRYRKPLPSNNVRKMKKASEVQFYEIALANLRKQNKQFYKPYDKQRLNISLMQAIKILRDAIQRDKDFTSALRSMGCKTRMRIRNKSAAKQLFQIMLEYLQDGKIPQQLKINHEKLLKKKDEQFQFNGLD